MTYQEAKYYRERKVELSDLVLENIQRGGSNRESISAALKDKFNVSRYLKAKATGLKEKFDPLNISRKLLGKTLTGILGNAFGRSKEDINYFTGGRYGNFYARKRGSLVPLGGQHDTSEALHTTVSEGQRRRLKSGDSVSDVLSKLYNVMKKNYEKEELRRELEIDFKFKEQKKKDKWHEELIEAITGQKRVKKEKKAEKKSGGFLSGLGDMLKQVKQMISVAIDGLKEMLAPVFEFISAVGKNLLGNIGRLLSNPLVLALLGTAAAGTLAVYLSAKLSEKLTQLVDEKVENMRAITPEQAAAILENATSEEDIKKAGGREYLEDIVKNGAERAKRILEEGDEKEINKAGGRELLEESVKQTEVSYVPQTETQLRDVPPRPDTSQGKNKQRALECDRKFSKDYNPDGKPKVVLQAKPLTEGVEPSTAGYGRGMGSLEDFNARSTPQTAAFGIMPHGIKPVEEKSSPVSLMPTAPSDVGLQAQQAIRENNDLLYKDLMPKVISIDNSKVIGMGGSNDSSPILFETNVSLRTDDPSMLKAQKMCLRPV